MPPIGCVSVTDHFCMCLSTRINGFCGNMLLFVYGINHLFGDKIHKDVILFKRWELHQFPEYAFQCVYAFKTGNQ